MDPTKLSKCDKIVGTPLYLSPEIIKAQPYDQRVDIWALGCALYELLTLVHPFYESDLSELCKTILTKSLNPIPAYIFCKITQNSCYSIAMRDLLFKLLDKNILNRPFIDEIICHQNFKDFKLSPIDLENLEQYKKYKHVFQMRNLKTPASAYQLLIKQLQKNIMEEPRSKDLYFLVTTGLQEEINKKKMRIRKEKKWRNVILEKCAQKQNNIEKYRERAIHIRKCSEINLIESKENEKSKNSKTIIYEKDNNSFEKTDEKQIRNLKLPELKKNMPSCNFEIAGNISTNAESLKYTRKRGHSMHFNANKSYGQTPSPQKRMWMDKNLEKMKENKQVLEAATILGGGNVNNITNFRQKPKMARGMTLQYNMHNAKGVKKVTINDLN